MSEQPGTTEPAKTIAQLTTEYQEATKAAQSALQVLRALDPTVALAHEKLRNANRAADRAENALLTALLGADA